MLLSFRAKKIAQAKIQSTLYPNMKYEGVSGRIGPKDSKNLGFHQLLYEVRSLSFHRLCAIGGYKTQKSSRALFQISAKEFSPISAHTGLII